MAEEQNSVAQKRVREEDKLPDGGADGEATLHRNLRGIMPITLQKDMFILNTSVHTVIVIFARMRTLLTNCVYMQSTIWIWLIWLKERCQCRCWSSKEA